METIRIKGRDGMLLDIEVPILAHVGPFVVHYTMFHRPTGENYLSRDLFTITHLPSRRALYKWHYTCDDAVAYIKRLLEADVDWTSCDEEAYTTIHRALWEQEMRGYPEQRRPIVEKPLPCTTVPAEVYYNYRECTTYLESLWDYDERDVAGKWRSEQAPHIPVHDFWQFVVDHMPDIKRNGSFFVMQESWGTDAAPWQQAILHRYLDAFGTGEPGDRHILFYVEE